MTKQKWHPNRSKALQNKTIWRVHAYNYDSRLKRGQKIFSLCQPLFSVPYFLSEVENLSSHSSTPNRPPPPWPPPLACCQPPCPRSSRLGEYFSHLTEYLIWTVVFRIFCYGQVWKMWLVIWNSVQPAWIKTWWWCKRIDSVNHALLEWQMKMGNWAREGMALTWFCYWSLGISHFKPTIISNAISI